MQFTVDSIKSSMIEKLQQTKGFATTILNYGIYSILLTVIAYVIEKLAYYGEFLYKESTWSTATLRRSLSAQAKFLSYKPHRKISPAGTVKIGGETTFAIAGPLVYTGATVSFPRRHQFSNNSGTIVVYATEPITYYTNTTIRNTLIDASSLAVNLGGGKVGIPVIAHAMPLGQLVSIRNSTNYDGDFVVDPLTTTNLVVIEATFFSEIFLGDEKIYTGHVYIPVKEGTTKVFTYVANGIKNEDVVIFSDTMDNTEIAAYIVDANDVILQTVIFTDRPYLENDLINYHAEVINAPDFSTVICRFGDGVRTRQLSAGERIRIEYADTKGAAGNIQGVATINTFLDTTLDADGNEATVFVTNDDEISDGNEVESIESIRVLAPALFQTGYRAADAADWVAIIESHPNVEKAVVWSYYDLTKLEVNPNQNVVFLTAVSSDGTGLTVSQQQDIALNYIKNKRDITDILSFQPLKVINLKFIITAIVGNEPFPDVQDTMFTALSAKYSILNTDFGPAYSIYESNFSNTLDDLPGVVLHKTEIFHLEKSANYEKLKASVGSYGITVRRLPADESNLDKQVFIQDSTPKLYLTRKMGGVLQDKRQIGQVNAIANTVFEGINGYTITGGIINYNESTISYNISDIINNTPPAVESDFAVAGTIKLQFPAPILGSDGTDYPVDTTAFTMDITVDGGITQTISVIAQDTQDIGALTAEINADLTGAIATFSDNDDFILITSNTTGNSSVVTLTDVDLIVNLFTTGGASVGDKVDGTAGTYGVLNPTELDLDGFFLELEYKTVNGEAAPSNLFLNDVRLPEFFHITDLIRDDLEFNLSYES